MLIRNRLYFVLLLGIIIPLGLYTRQGDAMLPAWVKTYGGDTLWTVAMYLALGILFPAQSATRRALLALGMSYLVEVSQLFNPPWLASIRSTWLGAKLLGHGFLWSDLICYTAGAGCAWLVETLLRKKSQDRA